MFGTQALKKGGLLEARSLLLHLAKNIVRQSTSNDARPPTTRKRGSFLGRHAALFPAFCPFPPPKQTLNAPPRRLLGNPLSGKRRTAAPFRVLSTRRTGIQEERRKRRGKIRLATGMEILDSRQGLRVPSHLKLLGAGFGAQEPGRQRHTQQPSKTRGVPDHCCCRSSSGETTHDQPAAFAPIRPWMPVSNRLSLHST